ncbi:BSD domain-containing protein [Actinidia rufa]|uniref:BSD domain-containing protein n=1 Tax=Actinidia rufa TaxID=165716 RepID=A0A7J0GDD7_9ERIC|nr:BSD domain-containing protein [Actinidia rufa]
MDFFKSVFSDDPEPSNPPNPPTSPPESQSDNQDLHRQPPPNPNPNPNPSIAGIANAWSFGGLIKTLATKSESVIETYRRDLEEFGSGLRKETAVIRDVAGRAVKDLPASLEAGALRPHRSRSNRWAKPSTTSGSRSPRSYLTPYSRIDAQIRAIQCDLNTYCKEPEDLKEYNEWKLGFKLGEKGGQIGDLIEENGSIEEIYNEVVPGVVDEETFWSRYFYRVYKVKKAEEARAKIVKRVISGEEEEVLSWDVDDDDYEVGGGSKSKGDSKERVEEEGSLEMGIDSFKVESEEKSLTSVSRVDERVHFDGSESSGNKLEAKSDEKMGSEGKTKNGGSCKESEFSVVSSQPLMPEEEDLGWDEIEDIGSTDEIKTSSSGSPNRSDLRKRLSAMEEEEDLGWNIEDDDEPVNETKPPSVEAKVAGYDPSGFCLESKLSIRGTSRSSEAGVDKLISPLRRIQFRGTDAMACGLTSEPYRGNCYPDRHGRLKASSSDDSFNASGLVKSSFNPLDVVLPVTCILNLQKSIGIVVLVA